MLRVCVGHRLLTLCEFAPGLHGAHDPYSLER
jgi:hypothetical protein